MGGILKTIISVGVVLILFMIAWKILKFAIAVLLPVAIIVIAAYILYNLFARRV